MWENILDSQYGYNTTALPVGLWIDIWLESKNLKKVDVDSFKWREEGSITVVT